MKKFLSLVLALVMTMSLVTVSAGAKDFTDNSKIAYGEAVDVMSAVKVIDGYADGSFNPSATLTRGAAAKIICNLILGPTTASALVADAAPYKDVPTTNVFAGYIAYCQKEGIISGYADGTFKPANSLTGYAFMKMLLGALGYDAETEGYTGANWSINVAKRAINIGLDDDLVSSFNGVKAVTREEACLYAFNTLKATMVEYDNNNSVTVNGITFTNKSAAKDMENKDKVETIKDDNKMQFAEKYFTDLKLNDKARDDFNRPSNEWKVKSEKVGTYPQTPDLTYTAKVKSKDVYKDLSLGSTIAASDVTVYVDGNEEKSVALKKGADDVIGQSTNGVLTEVYYDKDSDTVEIIQVHTYVGQISKSVAATSKKDAYVVISTLGGNPVGGSLEFETDEKFADDAYVLFTYAEGDVDEVKSVVVADKVEGTVTKVVNNANDDDNKKLTVAGTEYKMSSEYYVDGGSALNNIAVKNDYVVYLDAYGYAIYVEETEALSSDYALLLANQNKTNFSENKAMLVFADGTEKIVPTDKNYKDGSDDGIAAGTIVTYKVNKDGEYKLKEVKNTVKKGTFNKDTGVVTTVSTGFRLTNDKARITLNTADDQYIYANSKTVFVVYDKTNDDYSVYTGIKNAPTIDPSKNGSSVAYSYYCKSDNMATIIFIFADNGAITDSKNVALYLSKKSVSDLIHDEDGDYFEYNAIVDGKISTVKVAAKSGADTMEGYYSNYNTDKDGYITSGTHYTALSTNKIPNDGKYYLAGKGVSKTSADYTVTLDTQSGGKNLTVTVDENAKIFYEDKDGNISESSYKGIALDENDLVYAIIEDYMVKNLVICERDADDATVTVSFAGTGFSGKVGTKALATNNTVVKGDDFSFTLTADAGKAIKSVKVDGKELTPNVKGVYTLSNVKANTTVTVEVSTQVTLTVKSNDATKAAVTYNGTTTVVDNNTGLEIKDLAEGANVTLTIVPASGKTITKVEAANNFISGKDGTYTVTAMADGDVVITMG